jgi:hypothetical protein
MCWRHVDDISTREFREAAEIVAFDALEPSLRNRVTISDTAREIAIDETFRAQMKGLFIGFPKEKLNFPQSRIWL